MRRPPQKLQKGAALCGCGPDAQYGFKFIVPPRPIFSRRYMNIDEVL